ncbi:MAG: response regulator [Desulfobulbus sp.]
MYASLLFIDDDAQILNSLTRNLSTKYRVVVAERPEEGLRIFAENGPFSVLVSDMRMPGMNGVEVLCRAQEINADTTRILLTGYGDQQAAIEAVNKGRIFKFLTKPCPIQTLVPVLQEGIRQYKLNVNDRFVDERTRQGVAGLLFQILAMVNPAAQQKAQRLKDYCRHLAKGLRPQQCSMVEIAAVLSQLGCLDLSRKTMLASDGGAVVDHAAADRTREQYDVAARLLMHLPRFEVIIEILSLLDQPPSRFPAYDNIEMKETVPLCTRILQTALGLDSLLISGKSPEESLDMLRSNQPFYDSSLVDRLGSYEFVLHDEVLLYVRVSELTPCMVLAEDICDEDGTLLIAGGQLLAQSLLVYLHKVHRRIGLTEPIGVYLPLTKYAR